MVKKQKNVYAFGWNFYHAFLSLRFIYISNGMPQKVRFEARVTTQSESLASCTHRVSSVNYH